MSTDLQRRCEQLRSLHRPGDPLLLPNVWDVATAKAVVAAGFPAVATTSWGVAGAMGYEDDEQAPGHEMLAAAARIVRSVDVPVTVDAEGAYGMAPAEIAAALRDMGVAGCNLEDTRHDGRGTLGTLKDLDEHAAWLGAVREAADAAGHALVINARIDVFLEPYVAQAGAGTQLPLVPEAVRRAEAYLAAGADCVYPVALWEPDALEQFMAEVSGPVNLCCMPETPTAKELADLGAARVSWAIFLYLDAMARFEQQLAEIRG
jgi:2-methylisocitrate lyase-like PEP mutase family enzyme